jgi:hypothetical protein
MKIFVVHKFYASAEAGAGFVRFLEKFTTFDAFNHQD